jgi:hypothetical protein
MLAFCHSGCDWTFSNNPDIKRQAVLKLLGKNDQPNSYLRKVISCKKMQIGCSAWP